MKALDFVSKTMLARLMVLARGVRAWVRGSNTGLEATLMTYLALSSWYRRAQADRDSNRSIRIGICDASKRSRTHGHEGRNGGIF